MEDLFRVRLNGRHVLSLTRFTTVNEIEIFFNTIYNSKICLTLCNGKQITPNTEISPISDIKLDCFSEIFVKGNNIFIFHYFRKSYVYYRCKDCRRNAYFKDGKFKEKHLSNCRRIKSHTLIKSNREAETYFKSKGSTSEVSIDNSRFDSDSLPCSNSLVMKLTRKSDEVTDNYINSNHVSPKFVESLSPPAQDECKILRPNVATYLRYRKSVFDLNEKVEIRNGFDEKQFERKVEKK